MVNVAIIPGHSPKSPGAKAVDGIPEYKWQSKLATSIIKELKKTTGLSGKVYRRGDGSYHTQMPKLCTKLNDADVDLILELHFNAAAHGYYGHWHGMMAMHYPTSKYGASFAGHLADGMSEAFGSKTSGKYYGAYPTTVNFGGVELYVLTKTNAPAVLLETHYGDHAIEHPAMTEHRDSGELSVSIAFSIIGVLEDMGKLS